MPHSWEIVAQKVNSCLISILAPPGGVSVDWALSFANMEKPPAWDVIRLSGLPFGEARTQAAYQCLNGGYQWLFMVDCDILAPKDTITQLMSHRLPICVSGDSVVLGGNKDIATIQLSDRVLSRDGHEQNVLEAYEREYSGTLIEVKPRGLPSVVLTPEHLVLVSNIMHRKNWTKWNVQSMCWKPAQQLSGGDFLAIPRLKGEQSESISLKIVRRLRTEEREPIYKEIKEKLQKGWKKKDIAESLGWYPNNFANKLRVYSGEGYPPTRTFGVKQEVDEQLAKLFGLYVAEGYISDHEVIFSFHIKEGDLAEYIENTLRQKLGVSSYAKPIVKDNCLVVTAMSTYLARFMVGNFGRGAKNKYVPLFIKKSPKAIIKAFVEGIHLGDGDRHQGKYRISTASKRLAYDIFELLLKIDIPSCIRVVKGKARAIKGKEVKAGISYSVEFSALAWENRKDSINRRARSMVRFNQDYAFIPIKKVRTFEGTRKVYNLKTEDETFAIPFIVHNCSGLYYQRFPTWTGLSGDYLPCMFNETLGPDGKLQKQVITEFKPGSLVEAAYVPAGCLLTHRSVFERMLQAGIKRFFEWTLTAASEPPGSGRSEDFEFAARARAIGFKCFIDTSIVAIHETQSQVTPKGLQPKI